MSDPAEPTFNEADRSALLQVAESSVRHALMTRQMPAVDSARFSSALQETRASFVTLKLHDKLRGCIGSLTAQRPLVLDVAANAVSAAFNDPRFGPVGYYEVEQLHYHISVLSPPAPMSFTDEADLLGSTPPRRRRPHPRGARPS